MLSELALEKLIKQIMTLWTPTTDETPRNNPSDQEQYFDKPHFGGLVSCWSNSPRAMKWLVPSSRPLYIVASRRSYFSTNSAMVRLARIARALDQIVINTSHLNSAGSASLFQTSLPGISAQSLLALLTLTKRHIKKVFYEVGIEDKSNLIALINFESVGSQRFASRYSRYHGNWWT